MTDVSNFQIEAFDSGFGESEICYSNQISKENVHSFQDDCKLKVEVTENEINDIQLDLNYLIKTAYKCHTKTLNDMEKISTTLEHLLTGVSSVVSKTISRISAKSSSIALSDNTNMSDVFKRLLDVKKVVKLLRKDFTIATKSSSNSYLQEFESNIRRQRSLLFLIKDLIDNESAHSIEIVPNIQTFLMCLSDFFEELNVQKIKLGTNLNASDLILPLGQRTKYKKLHEKVVLDVYGDVRIGELRGCTILSSMRQFILTDYRNCRLLCYLKDGSFNRSIALNANPFDVTEVGTYVLAVSFPELKCVQLLDTKDNRDVICDEYQFAGRCLGISSYHEKLAVRIEHMGFCVVNLFSRKTITLKDKKEHMPYISFKGGKILYTSWKTGKVSCCDEGGDIKWEFQNEILQTPNGISTDLYGNVYVTSHNSDNIIYLSKDGLHAQKVIPYNGNMSKPLALHYDTNADELLVTFHIGIAVLYKVKNL